MVSMLSLIVLVVTLFAVVHQSQVDGLKIFAKDVPEITLERRRLVPVTLCDKITKDCINMIAVTVDDGEESMINTVSTPVVLNLDDYKEFRNVVEMYGLLEEGVLKGDILGEEMTEEA